MESSGRHYLCARCRTAVIVCSHCDRGQRYCAGGCAQMARAYSLKAAGQRYQTSLRGRRTHAARQRVYRAKQIKVTHQGSPPQPPSDLLPSIGETTSQSTKPASWQVAGYPTLCVEIAPPLPWHCHFCGRLQAQFVRHGYLRRRIRRPLRLPDRREAPHEHDP